MINALYFSGTTHSSCHAVFFNVFLPHSSSSFYSFTPAGRQGAANGIMLCVTVRGSHREVLLALMVGQTVTGTVLVNPRHGLFRHDLPRRRATQ